MSQSNNPPTGTPPHVHHHLPQGQQGPAGQAAKPEDQISPEDYKNPVVADYLITHLPAGITYVNGQPEAAQSATPPAPQPVFTPEQVARIVSDAIYDGLTKAPETFWPSLGRAAQLGFLQDGIDPRAVRVTLPFNAGQVTGGGLSMIKAVQGDKKAASMEVNIQELGQNVAAALRIERAREVLEPAFRVVEANQTVVLSGIASTVDKGLTRGESVIKSDGQLSWVLGPALAIRGGPANAALSSRAQNARTEEAIRADEQAKLKARQAGTPVEGPTQTTTVMTKSPGIAGPGAQSADISLPSGQKPKVHVPKK